MGIFIYSQIRRFVSNIILLSLVDFSCLNCPSSCVKLTSNTSFIMIQKACSYLLCLCVYNFILIHLTSYFVWLHGCTHFVMYHPITPPPSSFLKLALRNARSFSFSLGWKGADSPPMLFLTECCVFVF